MAYLAAKTSTIKLGTGILQIGTRTPTNMAMTAMALDSMSGGRFLLGVGTSGPQVIEGFHGVIFDKPVQRTRETIEIMKRVFSGERLAYDGQIYRLPVREGQGKSIRVEGRPAPHIPIYVASLGPNNLRLTGELADGWKGASFMPEHADVFFDHIREGAQRAGRSFADIDLQAGGSVHFTDDVEDAVEAFKPGLAFQLGAMGSRQFNFYHDAYSRAGYSEIAKTVQSLWIDGRRDEARELIPSEPSPEVQPHRHRRYGQSENPRLPRRRRNHAQPIFPLPPIRPRPQAKPSVSQRIQTLARLIDIVDQVNKEPAPAKMGDGR